MGPVKNFRSVGSSMFAEIRFTSPCFQSIGCISSKRLFEKSKIQNCRGLASFVITLERAKIENLDITTQNTVQNFEFLSFWRGKLHLD